MRFRIIELITGLAVVTIGIICLRESTRWAEWLFVNLTFVILLLTLVFAIGTQKSRRSFWLGFLSASSLFLAFSLVTDRPQDTSYDSRIEITTVISEWLLKTFDQRLWTETYDTNPFASVVGSLFCIEDILATPADTPALTQDDHPFGSDAIGGGEDPFGNDEWEDTGSGTGTIKAYPTEIIDYIGGPPVERSGHHFMAIARSLWALLLGWVVGHAAQFVYERSRA